MRYAKSEDWMVATVPGSVFKDLIKNGKMDDPFFRDNEFKALEISKNNFEYKRYFQINEIKSEKIWLVCNGLDTICDVYINNNLVLKANNMHRTYRVEISNYL